MGARISEQCGKGTLAVIPFKVSRYKQPVGARGFGCSNDAVFASSECSRIRQVQLTSKKASAYASKADSIEELVSFPFRDRNADVTLVHEGRFLQLIPESNRRKTVTFL